MCANLLRIEMIRFRVRKCNVAIRRGVEKLKKCHILLSSKKIDTKRLRI